MFNEINVPLIHGLTTPYGPPTDRDQTLADGFIAGVNELQAAFDFSDEFKSLLVDHCFAFDSCHGSIVADPRVLFKYLWLAYMMNDGKDLRELVDGIGQIYAKATKNS
jgi:hypothetical protein